MALRNCNPSSSRVPAGRQKFKILLSDIVKFRLTWSTCILFDAIKKPLTTPQEETKCLFLVSRRC